VTRADTTNPDTKGPEHHPGTVETGAAAATRDGPAPHQQGTNRHKLMDHQATVTTEASRLGPGALGG